MVRPINRANQSISVSPAISNKLMRTISSGLASTVTCVWWGRWDFPPMYHMKVLHYEDAECHCAFSCTVVSDLDCLQCLSRYSRYRDIL